MLTPRTVSEAICEEPPARTLYSASAPKFVLYRQSSDEDKRKIVLVNEDGNSRRHVQSAASRGHLHAAELAHRALNLDRVLFISDQYSAAQGNCRRTPRP